MRRSARKIATVILRQDAGNELPHLSFGDDALLIDLESDAEAQAARDATRLVLELEDRVRPVVLVQGRVYQPGVAGA